MFVYWNNTRYMCKLLISAEWLNVLPHKREMVVRLLFYLYILKGYIKHEINRKSDCRLIDSNNVNNSLLR